MFINYFCSTLWISCLLVEVSRAVVPRERHVMTSDSDIYWRGDDDLQYAGSRQRAHYRRKRQSSVDDRPSCSQGGTPSPIQVDSTGRLQRLREQMQQHNLQAYIIPTNDQHQSEYVSEHDKRRVYISGFSGSAGTAVVTLSEAALWTDGRYFLQAEQELDCNWLLMKQRIPGFPTISEWLNDRLSDGNRVGVDPKLVGQAFYDNLEKKLSKEFKNLMPIEENLVDIIWENQPSASSAPTFVLADKYNGKPWQEKVEQIREATRKKLGGDNVKPLLVVTALDEVAWLFNLRGADIPYNPVFFAYAMITDDQVSLYININKVNDEVKQHLGAVNGCTGICTRLASYEEIFSDIQRESAKSEIDKVLISESSSYAIFNAVSPSKRVVQPATPILLIKAQKNPVEQEGMRQAHIRDAVALIDFMAMLEKGVKNGEEWDEISAMTKLDEYRSKQKDNHGASFDTISAVGSNGAVIHYSSQPKTNRPITTTEMYLLDSGGQYKDGTTDVTRTFHFGTPTPFEKEAYTRVLMGAINLAEGIFPYDKNQGEFDALARQPLWNVGLDYRHGTSHGIGHFLYVHEGPTSDPCLPGIFMSDEPGYYEEGKFGVRLETIVMVTEANTRYNFGHKDDQTFLTFEAITLVPFEPILINYNLLTNAQKKWLNRYNAKIREKVGPVLKQQGRNEGYDWMFSRTEPIEISEKVCQNSNSVAPVATSIFLVSLSLSFVVGKLL